MGKTLKTEYSTPDGWHIGHRLARKARAAGRMIAVLEAEAAADGEDDWSDPFAELEAELQWHAEVDAFEAEFDCRCGCRRCLLHGDCGGCLTGHEEEE